MLGVPILYCMGMRPMMFQLSGFCYKPLSPQFRSSSSEGFGAAGSNQVSVLSARRAFFLCRMWGLGVLGFRV